MKKAYSLNQSCLIFLLPILLSLGISHERISAQNAVIEEIIEELASATSDEDLDYSGIIEDLLFFSENPLNLNMATIESLEKLYLLNEDQIINLMRYIDSKGPMKTIYELQLIEDFDFTTINRILPFVKVENPKLDEDINIKKIYQYGKHRFSGETRFVIQDQAGYLPNKNQDTSYYSGPAYQGDKEKYLFRYRFTYKSRIFAGITAEKDPGEKIEFNRKKYGFDFYSFHFQINKLGKFKSIVIGDFQAQFGQGLILWSGFGLGKSPDVMNLRKKGPALRYYSSTDESSFFRGAGTTLKFGRIEFSTFFSHKKIDACLSTPDSTNESAMRISSFQNTGFHRTENELINRKTVGESVFGSSTKMMWDNFKTGMNLIAYHLQFIPAFNEKPYKYFEEKQKTALNLSIDYVLFSKKMHFFGEAAISNNGAFAMVNSMSVKATPAISFSLLNRYYQENYQARYANSFSEGSSINNETGLYYGLIIHPIRKLKISAYVDMFRFPWLKYSVNAPSGGKEYLLQADYNLNRNFGMYFRWKNETKSANQSETNETITRIEETSKHNFRYHITCRITPFLSLRNRIEFTKYSKNGTNEYGFLILQDLNFDFTIIPLSLDIRYSVFDATYNARIYAWENDLLYNFSVPAYSGKGNRIYLMAKYKFLRKIDVRLRYSHFLYSDRENTGSGLDMIEGNFKSEIKFQVVINL